MFTILFLAALLPLAIQAASSNKAEQAALSSQIQSCNRFKSYTALGDSYAAGYGADDRLGLCDKNEPSGTASCTTEDCGKDTGAYGYLFWKEFDIENFQYLACAGANTSQVLNTQVNTDAFGGPDLITINVGGDDGKMFTDVITNCATIEYDSAECTKAIHHAGNEIRYHLPQSLKTLFAAIKDKAAARDATVVVMSYARFWPKKEDWYCFWSLFSASSEQQLEIDALIVLVNKLLQSKAAEAGFLYADLDAAYEGHRFCDTNERWFQEAATAWLDQNDDPYWEWSMFHPTLDGQKKGYLAALKQILDC